MTRKVLFVALFALLATQNVKAANDELTAFNAEPTADSTNKPKGNWTTSSTPAIKIGEFIYHNWSATGNSQIDITGTFFGNYKYTHPKYVWDNIADLAYGFAWQDLDNSDTVGGRFETRRKSNDKIDLTSSLSWKAYKDWGANFTANFKSQFGKGYTYEGFGPNAIETQVSGFMAPGYLTTALSFEHKRDNWSVSLSFLTGKTTFVCDDSLIAHNYNYGVIQGDDFNIADPSTYTHVYFALGSYIKAQYLKKDLLPSLDLYARLELFYDYKKPKNMAWSDIDSWDGLTANAGSSKYTLSDGETWTDLQDKGWLGKRIFETDLDLELKLDYRFSKYISANFALNIKWDTDFSGMGNWGHWQIYQMAGVQVFFSWKIPK